MPIPLVSTPSAAIAAGRSIRIPGLPDFNADDPAFKINTFEGWFDSQTPVPVLIANGGGPGSFAVGDWAPGEQYYTLGGRIDVGPSGYATMRRLLLQAFPADREIALACLGNGIDDDLQVFVRLYDRLTVPPGESVLRFTVPLVASDPYKYALEPLAGTVGVFAGVDWYRQYDVTSTPPSRTYVSDGVGGWYRSYARQGNNGPYPLSWGANSPGDATSRRLTITVAGPQPDGWWVERQDADGNVVEQLYVDQALTPEQTVVFDCQPPYSATINGADVAHLTFGDFLTLPPGGSTFRLVAPADLGGHASFSALPAYL